MQRYVSHELFHFVGRGEPEARQYDLLLTIVRSGWLTHPPHHPMVAGNLFVNPNARLSRNEMYSPQVVCFCDIPLQELEIHVQKYSRFGLAFSKEVIVQHGGAPVHYIPMTAQIQVSGPWSLEPIDAGEYFDKMVREYHDLFTICERMIREKEEWPAVQGDSRRLWTLRTFFDFHVFSYLKFFDHTLPDHHPENYYFEREWRLIGNLQFAVKDVSTIVVPTSYAERLSADLPDFTGRRHFLD